MSVMRERRNVLPLMMAVVAIRYSVAAVAALFRGAPR